jgi:hypothetical protein
MHQGVTVFVEDGDWYVQFQTRCRNLGLDNRCTVYESRPAVCREYEPGACDYSGAGYGYQHLFIAPQQLEEYYLRKTGKPLGPVSVSTPRRRRKSPGNRNGAEARRLTG